MARHITNQDPTGLIVARTSPAGQVNANALQAVRGQSQGWKVWVGQADPTSSSEANLSFQNPEIGQIVARASWVVVTAGTGTLDIGTGTSGTGSGAEIIDGGTLTVGWHSAYTDHGTVSASATIGALDLGVVLLAGNGTVADSIVARVTDGVVSTAEVYLVVEYIDLIVGSTPQ